MSQATSTMTVDLVGEREIVMTRTFNAPRERVFRAFTEPEQLTQWWGPEQFTLPHCDLDLRPGGTWLYCMRGPDGQDYWGKAVYQEIEPPARLVYLDAFADADGNETSTPTLVTVTFDESEGRTTVSMTTICNSAEEREALLTMGMEEGLCQSYDRLDALFEAER